MNTPGPDRLSDEEILVELRDMKQRIAVLIEGVTERVERQMATYRKIIAAIREEDTLEKLADAAIREVAPDFESLTHECAIPERFSTRCDACGE